MQETNDFIGFLFSFTGLFPCIPALASLDLTLLFERGFVWSLVDGNCAFLASGLSVLTLLLGAESSTVRMRPE
jgi:hypothetical protein